MSVDFHSVIDNAETLVGAGAFCAILGETPSSGARSPALWNAVLQHCGRSEVFLPLDIKPSNFADAIKILKETKSFLGGAVAIPFKQAVIPYLDDIEPSVSKIGAVNALYRRDGALIGANTDGEGALTSLRRALPADRSLKGATILQLGLGGAGRAVATYLASAVGTQGSLILCSRQFISAQHMVQALGSHVIAHRPVDISNLIEIADVVVNTTSVGFQPNPRPGDVAPGLWRSPLSPDTEPAESLAVTMQLLSRVQSHCLIYDIVYQPEDTLLLRCARSLGLPTLNGRGMNLSQAVLAFRRVFPDLLGFDEVHDRMATVP